MAGSSYNFRTEQVHLVDMRCRGTMRFRCFRCKRELPESSFGPLPTLELDANFIDHQTSFMALHPFCWTCRKQLRGRWANHQDYTPALDRYFGRMMDGIRAGAKARGIACLIDKDDVIGLFFEQKQRCAITGMEMKLSYNRSVPGIRNLLKTPKPRNTPSVDRINSSGNYVVGNIQLVLSVVNTMKNDMAMPTFVEMCRRVVAGADRAHTAKASE